MKYIVFACLALSLSAQAQQAKRTANSGHSHNDYNQNFPFYTAYHAGMGSVEADIYLKKGKLLVAHNEEDTDTGKTLSAMYLDPIVKAFRSHNGNIYADTSKKMQLVIDIKADYKAVLPVLVTALKPNLEIFDPKLNKNAVRIVISGDTPAPADFGKYPSYISFDGRPYISYTPEQLERVAMISDEISSYSVWNGKGTPTPPDLEKMKTVIAKSHALHKPFRFWATKDNPNSWKELEHMGADWIGTDHPQQLQNYYNSRDKVEYVNPKPYQPYQPSYKNDGGKGKVKNVILLIGDGMGLAQIQAASSANGGQLNILKMRHIGLSKTEALNSDFTDSAAGGTAMAIGKKTNNRYIGMDGNGKAGASIPDTLAARNIKSGVISSGDITDATPAAFYAHQIDRSLSVAIAADFQYSNVDILVGSNRKSFSDNKDTDLMEKLSKKGYQLSKSMDEFKASTSGKQLVLLDDSSTRPIRAGRGDFLKAAFLKTVELLSDSKAGFFIMTEGAQIDYGGHANDLPYAVTELHDFDQVVAEALKFADRDGETLVIVTADHETGGLSMLDADYRNNTVRGNFSTDDHTNIMVPVFAYGPGAEDFSGVYDNTQIFHKIVKALGPR